jgi:predicted lipid carrier protein YhbT
VAQYLSDEWFGEMQAAAAAFKGEVNEKRPVSLRETISDSPLGTITYVMTLDGASIVISRDADTEADVTFTQDYPTAVALHKGELTTHEAFFNGKVRVAGHLNTLLSNADVLQGIAPVFEAVRATTAY